MSTLKKDLHNLIDSTENESLLRDFYRLLKTRISRNEGSLWKELTREQKDELLRAYDESQKDENLLELNEVRKGQ